MEHAADVDGTAEHVTDAQITDAQVTAGDCPGGAGNPSTGMALTAGGATCKGPRCKVRHLQDARALASWAEARARRQCGGLSEHPLPVCGNYFAGATSPEPPARAASKRRVTSAQLTSDHSFCT